MADATPRTYVYGLILFTLVTVAGISMLSIYGADNPAALTGKYTQFNESMNKLADVNTEINSLDTSVQGNDPDPGTFGVLNGLINGAWQTLRLMGSSFSFMTDAYDAMGDIFGVPSWIPGLVALLITAMVVFAIFSAIFQTEL